MSSSKREMCPACNKAVYFNEQVIFCSKPWHKTCLKCAHCHKLLTVDTVLEHANSPYCKPDYQRLFGVKGYTTNATTTISTENSGAMTSTGVLSALVKETGTGVTTDGVKQYFEKGCPKCGKAVYMAERTSGANKDWHKFCFRCWDCDCLLHAGGYTVREDKFPYCKKCYAKNFGIEGYGHMGATRNLHVEVSKVDAKVTDKIEETTTANPDFGLNTVPTSDSSATPTSTTTETTTPTPTETTPTESH
ncbi:LIM protein [Pelomyxa schiedti]|nr:LIM protein [Pelomyxa schiedti]